MTHVLKSVKYTIARMASIIPNATLRNVDAFAGYENPSGRNPISEIKNNATLNAFQMQYKHSAEIMIS